jgi:hypothetical protein
MNSKYDEIVVANELINIALNKEYCENSLYAARTFNCVTKNDIDCINRFLFATPTDTDYIRLQEIAIEIISVYSVNQYYTDRNNSEYAALSR